MAKVTFDDLTYDQLEAIEDDIGPYPFEGVSRFKVLVKLLAAVNGDGEERYRAMKLPELIELASVDSDSPPNE